MGKRGIKTKVSNLVFAVSAVAIAVVSTVSFVQIFGMKNSTTEISGTLGEKAAEGSEKALEELALSQILSLTTSKTTYADAKLTSIVQQSQVVAGLAADIYNNPQGYVESSVSRPDAANAGVFVGQYLHAENFDEQKNADEISALANIATSLNQVAMSDDNIKAAQIGTETGFVLFGDADSEKKVNMEFSDPRERPWYINAKAAGKTVFSDIVDDAFGRGLGLVCATPVYDNSGTLRAVVGIGAMITEMSTTIANDQLGGNSYTFALDGKGNIIISPTLETMADSRNLLESTNSAEAELGRKMTTHETGVDKLVLDGKDVYVAYAPLSVTDWSICTVIDVEDVLQPAIANAEEITQLTDEAVSKIDSSIMFMLILFLVIIGAILIATIFVAGLFSRSLMKPILSLTESIGDLKNENIIYTSNISSGDEIEVLSHSFEEMTHRLASYIENITKITAEKERIGAELNVATHIQANMLPSIFPAFPDRPEFDVYATMTPAKEVGGDFYDFFLVDDDHLALVIADVSGKGVPAALFMVIAKTLIKNAAQLGLSAKQVLEKVNNQLCENNEAGMFVTVWLGLYQISTGKMTCANAGHEFPAIRRANGEYELIKDKHGFVLAGMEGARYREYEIEFHKGDRLYVYTDGVAEATDAHEELFGTERMIEALNKWRAEDYDTLLHKMKKSIDEFVGDAPQFDDITMLSFEVKSVADEEGEKSV